jgi:ABC-type microcin C transport system permease subunit YejB
MCHKFLPKSEMLLNPWSCLRYRFQIRALDYHMGIMRRTIRLLNGDYPFDEDSEERYKKNRKDCCRFAFGYRPLRAKKIKLFTVKSWLSITAVGQIEDV